MKHHRLPVRLTLLLTLTLAAVVVSAGCERRVDPMSQAEVAAALEGQPPIFHLEEGAMTLEGMEGFHLYQSREEALEELARWCPRTTDYEGDWTQEHTTFKGCKTPDHPWIDTVRIGFHPQLDDRVFTIEQKRRTVPLDAVRARVTAAYGDELVEDVPRAGILMMGTPRYKFFADLDEGKEGLAHVLVGVAPAAITR